MNAPTTATVLGGRYRLDHLLGRGGMGVVWAGHDTLLDRPVAVKMLREDLSHDEPTLRDRLLAEARAAAAVHHPNLVSTFDAGYDDGSLALVMERLPGRSLADRIAEGHLSPAEARAVTSDVLAGLEALHLSGLVHRDVKPANILEASDGSWKVVDFGIAKSLDGGSDLTATGTTIGTPAYLAPEQLGGERATARSDVWSVGVMLYESLAGQRPFSGDTPFAIADAVRTTSPQPLSVLRSDLDPEIVATVDRALQKSPDDRFSSASEMAASLHTKTGPAVPATVQMAAAVEPTQAFVATAPMSPVPAQGIAAGSPAGRAQAASGWRARPRLVALAAVLIVLLLGAAVLAQSLDDDGGGDGSADGATSEQIHSLGVATAGLAKAGSAPATTPSTTVASVSTPPPTDSPPQPEGTIATEPNKGDDNKVDDNKGDDRGDGDDKGDDDKGDGEGGKGDDG